MDTPPPNNKVAYIVTALLAVVTLGAILSCAGGIWYFNKGFKRQARAYNQALQLSRKGMQAANVPPLRFDDSRSKTLKQFLTYLQAGDTDKAIKLTSPEFRKKHTATSLKSMLENHPEIKSKLQLINTKYQRSGSTIVQANYRYTIPPLGKNAFEISIEMRANGRSSWLVTDLKVKK